MALDALEEADKALREHTVTASKWQESKRAFDAAQEAYETLENEIEGRSVEQRKLSRIRRVYRQVLRLAAVEAEVAGLGEVPPLPDDAETRLATAMQELSDAQSKLDELDGQLAQARSARSDLLCDETILLRSEEIGHSTSTILFTKVVISVARSALIPSAFTTYTGPGSVTRTLSQLTLVRPYLASRASFKAFFSLSARE